MLGTVLDTRDSAAKQTPRPPRADKLVGETLGKGINKILLDWAKGCEGNQQEEGDTPGEDTFDSAFLER